jgi:hypothetical protein
MFTQLNLFVLPCLCFALFSCAKTPEQELESALNEARYHLNTMNCSRALDALGAISEDKTDPDFVSVMASAIACNAGYTDTTAITNLTNINISSAAFLGSFAAFPTSNETAADAASYSKILEGITYILDADTGLTPSTTKRLSDYGTAAGNDLSMQALMMISVAMGKYFAYYGNTNTAGLKGAGTAGNGCIAFYPFDASVNTTIVNDEAGPDLFGSCNNATDGHADLDTGGGVAAITVKRRMCEGIILFNNLFEILSNIDLSSNSTLGNLTSVSTTLQTLFTASQTAETLVPWGATAVTDMQGMTSQTACEAESDANIQRYYVLLFEFYL